MKTKSFFFLGELFAAVCSAFCRYGIRFIFYYVEQLQVFPLTWACFEETCRQPGGLACLVGFPFCNSIIFLWVVRWFRPVCFGDRCADATDLPANDIACLLLFTGSLPDSGFAPFACRCELPVAGDGCLLLLCLGLLYSMCVLSYRGNGYWRLAVDGCFVCIGRAGGNLVRCRSRGPGDVVAGEGMARMSGTSVRDCPDALWSYRFFWQPEYRMIVLPDFYYEPLLKANKLYWAWLAFSFGAFNGLLPDRKRQRRVGSDCLVVDHSPAVAFGCLFWGG